LKTIFAELIQRPYSQYS